MILTVEELKKHITTELSDEVLEEKLRALEIAIRKYTNNNFQNRKIRAIGNIENGTLKFDRVGFKETDTIQITGSQYNDGVWTLKTAKFDIDEPNVIVTKVEYPEDVKMGVIEILRWKIKNEDQNYNPEADKEVQSETISRHSVTYAKDATESDISQEFGVPKKYMSFLKMYKKARF